ncbi:hypothetical protein SO694_00030247 [Aureococcus anophagefferens]|uniref:LamG-like jellyroll fold domain-containing protein n=1 Tax=Aureococcus anophagefferens TaxID=44056 RepID=A0ABR1FJZ2_AURAN
MYGLRVGADMYESNKLTGAIDELYVYTSALDREAISVLYGSVTASPTVTPAPSTYYFEGTLRAYYSFDEGNATDATGAYSGDTYKNGHARNLGPAGEPRRRGRALGFDGEVYAVLPDALTYEALTGDEERTICLWARIDDWDGGFLFEYGSDSAGGASFGLAVGDAESNVTLALSGSYQTVVTIYGNTSYIDWDDWHHYCLTYDGSDVVLYFDGLAGGDRPRVSRHGDHVRASVGADMYESNKLTGAIDELYVYTSALDREAISVLYGTGARNLGPAESRDGGDALGFDGEVYAVLPDALTYEALTGDEERTICLWARIDDWDGGFLFEYGERLGRRASFGLAVGDAESNVTLALSADVVLYFDGLAEARPASLDTETMYGLRVGADMYESNKLTGAIDELYVYTSALDREAISVLYGSVTASPTVTPAPSTYYFEGTLRAYYSFDEGNATDATGAYSGDTYKNGHARNLGPTESRDGNALGFDGEVYAVLPDALTYEALTGDEERTICLWARIDDWDGGFLFEYGATRPAETSFGLAVGDAESNVTLALSGSYQTVVTIYGNTSYIDWDDWHHYCLTYDGSDVVLYFDGLAEATAPASLDTETMYGLRVGADMYESNKLTGAIDELYVYTSALDREAISVLYGDVVLYFDGLAEATAPASLDTETMYGLRVGADMYESNKLTGAIDELYVYTSALDREAISVLYGSVTASPTVTPAPSTYYFEGTLRAYYSFDEGNATDATGAYSGDTYKNGHARNLGPAESRDGGDALGFDGEVYAVLPDALTYEALTGDEERTICLWARIDDWDGGFLFEYGSDSAGGASFGLAVGDAESNVTLALSGSDVVLYFDGLAEATAPASLDTETMYGLRVGADMYESNKLTGAIDELYVYTSALDREAISVLYGSVTASPTVTPAPSTYYFEGTLRAYYSFDEGNATDATGAYSGDTYKNGHAREPRPDGEPRRGTRSASTAKSTQSCPTL